MPSTFTTIVAVGSLIAPVKTGVVSLVVTSSKDTTGALVSTVTTAVSLPTLPAASVAVTVMVCGPSVNAGSVLSARVQVPSPLLVAG